MQHSTPIPTATPNGFFGHLATNVGRILISLIVPIVTFVVLWQGFLFLRDSNAPKLVIALVAIVWGVGGVALLYGVANWVVERMSEHWRSHLQPVSYTHLTLPTNREV